MVVANIHQPYRCLNAWSLHRLVHGKELDLLEFRRRVAISLLKSETDEDQETSVVHNPHLTGRPSGMKSMADPRKKTTENITL